MKRLLSLFIVFIISLIISGCASSSGSKYYGNGWYVPPVEPVGPDSYILVTKTGENIAYVGKDDTQAIFKFRLGEKWTLESSKETDNSSVTFNPQSGDGNDNIVTATFPVNDGDYKKTYTIPVYSALSGNQITSVKIIQEAEIKEKAWLYITYIAGDNNLTAFQLDNLQAMESVGSDENTHMIAFIDIGEGTNLQGTEWEGKLDWKNARSFYLTKNSQTGERAIKSDCLDDYGKVNSGSGETLEKFLTETLTTYPSKNIALILNNHGEGYLGALSDDENHSMMSCKDIKNALLNAENATGRKIDIIGFDACLMASFENLYELRNTADFFCVSEENILGEGWDYEELLNSTKNNSTNMIKPVNPMLDAMKEIQESELSKIAADITPEEFGRKAVMMASNHPFTIMHFACLRAADFEYVKTLIDEFALTIIYNVDKVQTEEERERFKKWCREKMLHIPGDSTEAALEYGDLGTGLYDLNTIAKTIIYDYMHNPMYLAAQTLDRETRSSSLIVLFTNSSRFKSEYFYSISCSIFLHSDQFASIESDYMELEFAQTTKWLEMLKKIEMI